MLPGCKRHMLEEGECQRGGNGVENTGIFKLRNKKRGKEVEGTEKNHD